MTGEDLAFHGCAALVLAALVVLYAVRADRGPVPRWLDRQINAALDWSDRRAAR